MNRIQNPSTRPDPLRKLLVIVMMCAAAFLFVVAGYAIAIGDGIAVPVLLAGWLNLWLLRREG